MSQYIGESPVWDNKMDISETNTSQEPTGVSPIVENIIEEVVTNNLCSISNNATNKTLSSILPILTESPSSSSKTNVIYGSSNKNVINNFILIADNMKMNPVKKMNNIENILNMDDNKLNKNILHEDQQKLLHLPQNCSRSELTIVSNHPLMSSPGTDSDSENNISYHNNKVISYPDVIPQNVPLFLGNSHENIVNENQYSTKIKSTSATNSIKSKTNLNINSDGTIKNSVSKETKNLQHKRKICVRRDDSPDIISSESDQEISQYRTNVEPNYQTVTLLSNNVSKSMKAFLPKSLGKRKIPITADIISDVSSLDSVSNPSFDNDNDDIEHNLASLSPSSSVFDGFNEKNDDFSELETLINAQPTEPIQLYSVEDEKRDSRSWQKITLPDGRIREIDMKVIEPYKRVFSHGGYLKAGGHNAIVMFCACHLPDKSRTDYHYVMDNLFLYVVKTLEQLITEDYVLIYLHGGSSRRNVPPFPWLKKCYQLVDRKLKKSLKNLYLVHPSFWLKSIVWMSRPFVSSKFWRKLVYVHSLEELYTLVSVEKTAIPDKVKEYNASIHKKK